MKLMISFLVLLVMISLVPPVFAMAVRRKATCSDHAWAAGAQGYGAAHDAGYVVGSHEFQITYESVRDNYLCSRGCDPTKYTYADYELNILEKGNPC